MQYLGHSHTKNFIAYLKFKFNWASYISSGNLTTIPPPLNEMQYLNIVYAQHE